MFHLLLVPLALMTAGIAIAILAAPICIGSVLQIIFSIVSKDGTWPRYVPLGLGLLGLVLTVIFLMETIEQLLGILIYWGTYCGCIWLVAWVVRKIKKFIARRREK